VKSASREKSQRLYRAFTILFSLSVKVSVKSDINPVQLETWSFSTLWEEQALYPPPPSSQGERKPDSKSLFLVLRQGFFDGCNPSKNPSNPIQPTLNFKLTDH
jgi:hypothetical protein